MKVFLSYAREDIDFALHLATDLRAAGVDLWVDRLDIPPGEIWDREVEKALQSCSHLLVVLSPESVNSDNVMNEVSFALDKSRSIVPVLYKSCDIPFRLGRFQYIDLMFDYRNGLSALVDVLPRSLESQSGDKLLKIIFDYLANAFEKVKGVARFALLTVTATIFTAIVYDRFIRGDSGPSVREIAPMLALVGMIIAILYRFLTCASRK